MDIKKKLVTLSAAGAMTLAGFGVAPPAQAAPVITGGLVNVTITDVNLLNENDVVVTALNGVTLAVAANVCGVAVGVLATDLQDGDATCRVVQDADSTATTTVTQRRAR